MFCRSANPAHRVREEDFSLFCLFQPNDRRRRDVPGLYRRARLIPENPIGSIRARRLCSIGTTIHSRYGEYFFQNGLPHPFPLGPGNPFVRILIVPFPGKQVYDVRILPPANSLRPTSSHYDLQNCQFTRRLFLIFFF